jgi:hypothetical protein
MRWIFLWVYKDVYRDARQRLVCKVGVAVHRAMRGRRSARQPMIGKKGFHSSTPADKAPAATGFGAVAATVAVVT